MNARRVHRHCCGNSFQVTRPDFYSETGWSCMVTKLILSHTDMTQRWVIPACSAVSRSCVWTRIDKARCVEYVQSLQLALTRTTTDNTVAVVRDATFCFAQWDPCSTGPTRVHRHKINDVRLRDCLRCPCSISRLRTSSHLANAIVSGSVRLGQAWSGLFRLYQSHICWQLLARLAAYSLT